MTMQSNSNSDNFNYELAFSRNIGWITESEQQQLRTKKIAIAGMGGVGGFHLLTLVRLGMSRFNIADFDKFEIQNFNRQIGANLNTLHQDKAQVLFQMASSINPDIEINIFNEGINDENMANFLNGVDLYIDGLDFFVLKLREKLYQMCQELSIPAITAGPIGMSTSYLIFMPDQMSFEEYFRMKKLPDVEKRFQFLVGLTPNLLPLKYLVKKSSINLEERRGPSTVMACELCAGVVGTEALKILLNRGPIYPAPYYHYFDAYLCKYERGYLRWGNNHPKQKLKLLLMKYKKQTIEESNISMNPSANHHSVIEKILDIARWAPSADNNQPWKFHIKNNNEVSILIKNIIEENISVGILTLISAGTLIESIRLAATKFKKTCKFTLANLNKNTYELNIIFHDDLSVKEDQLLYFIPYRSVNRKSYKKYKLSKRQIKILEESLGNEFTIKWHTSISEKWKAIMVNILATKIRLTTPEIFQSNQNIIDYDHNFSKDKLPINSLNMSSLSKKLIRIALKSWKNANFLNKFLGAPYFVAFELDLIPGIFSSAHFDIIMKDTNNSDKMSYIRAGEALQRFWLTAEMLGLVLQPSFAAVIFAYYEKHNIHFTKNVKAIKHANEIANNFSLNYGESNFVILRGRIGVAESPTITSRSIRKPLSELLY